MHPISRRQLLQSTSCGFGLLALAGLCAQQAKANPDASTNPLAPRPPHFAPKAKRVIFMFMQGAPSHVDTFDYKPQLIKDDGKSPGQANGKGNRKLLKSPWKFPQSGNSGLPISELFPNLSKHADDLCLLNSLHCDLPNHPQAAVQMHTGNFQFVRPSLGSWVLYGLGSENQELPGFITINPISRIGGAQNYGSSFLPAAFQGTKIGGEGVQLAKASVANIRNTQLTTPQQRQQLDLLQKLNQDRLQVDKVNPELEGIIESYELAFRMQAAVPKVMDFADESPATLESYGIGDKATDNFGRQCLLARRFAESGVRFIEVGMGGWDQHQQLRTKLTQNCTSIDRPIAALLNDLKQRSMLKDTLVIWGGEFGRTPHAQNEDGRDHNATGFSMFMAGGGVKGGLRYGATDEHGIKAVEDKMHIHDLHATVLHLLGLDHERLTYRYSGRDFRLTDVHGNIAKKILA
ncbi:DUF1501 domain-containing protein [Anatilimnocola floriformis]|uniref:DUF1501 domain-containing protein n=1 Tax=Anatilimnocola floriformis TaxID=2948575 RepID=UPI0020C45EBC|nr:DUF1501 domain-containing protein [Anatilimnocola floriformis]